MTVAILVLAHGCPSTLAATSRALSVSPEISLFVHVDAKADLAAYRKQLGEELPGNITLSESRTDVYWAGFSMVEATFNLLKLALETSDAGFFALISDDSYPLVNAERLVSSIKESGLPRINTWRVPDDHLFRQRYDKFFFMDSKFSNPRWFLNEQRSVGEAELAELNRLRAIMTYGKHPLPDLYCGKQWWVLPRKECETILSLHTSNVLLRDSFRYSAVPDETYVQTLFRLCFPAAEVLPHLMFDDFARDPKPYVFKSVAELRQQDLTDRLFARKVLFGSEDEYRELLN